MQTSRNLNFTIFLQISFYYNFFYLSFISYYCFDGLLKVLCCALLFIPKNTYSPFHFHPGLGPEGTGRKFPIKTVLKQDRQGVGCKSKKKAKITHFSAHDTRAVGSMEEGKTKRGSRVPRKTWKKNLLEKQEKEKKWEHNLRVYMNTDN